MRDYIEKLSFANHFGSTVFIVPSPAKEEFCLLYLSLAQYERGHAYTYHCFPLVSYTQILFSHKGHQPITPYNFDIETLFVCVPNALRRVPFER